LLVFILRQGQAAWAERRAALTAHTVFAANRRATMGAGCFANKHIGGRDFGFIKAGATFRAFFRIGVYFSSTIGAGEHKLFTTLGTLHSVSGERRIAVGAALAAAARARREVKIHLSAAVRAGCCVGQRRTAVTADGVVRTNFLLTYRAEELPRRAALRTGGIRGADGCATFRAQVLAAVGTGFAADRQMTLARWTF
jgi:hypothetical protein